MIKASEEIYEIIQDLSKIHLPENDKFEISYDVNKLIVNCDKEEIQGIIYSKYQNQGKKLQVQELQDFVLEKVSLTLPQDIILLINYSGYKQKHSNVADKIINFYQKGEHNNLYNFIRNMENTKNVIYTFSSIDEPLLPNIFDSFDTKLFGKINKNDITEVIISSLSAEIELEAELEKFYLEPNKKIFVLKFNPEETDIMNYIKFFIENHIKEKNYNDENIKNKKAFIFSIHMNRIFEDDKKDPKKKKYIERNELGELISHLSDFYQICIDNLNGEDISLIEIMKCKEEELFRKCLNLDKEFMKNIYYAFSYFNFEFIFDVPKINKDNYSIQLIEYLKEEKELTNNIIKCVLRQRTNEKDIFGKILKTNYLNQEDISIISVVQRYLSELFTDNLTQFVFKSEKDHFLSTFLYNKLYCSENVNNNNIIINDDKKEEEMNLHQEDNKLKENLNEKDNIINMNEKEKNKDYLKNELLNYKNNKIISKLTNYYLEELDTSLTSRFNKKIQANKIIILLGLKLPGIKYTLNSFRTYIKNNLSKHFFELETLIRSLSQEEAQEINNIKIKIKYKQKNMDTEISRNELFEHLNDCIKENQKDSSQFYQWLLDDYYLLFLSDTLQNINNSFNNLEDYKNLLKKMISFRFNSNPGNDEVDPISSLAIKMLWLESNSEYISILLNLYQKISIYEKDLLSKIEKIIENKEIQYEISERCPYFTEEVNSPFFYIMESLLKVITNDLEIYNNLKEEEFYDYINSLKTIVQNSFRIVRELLILSKEIFTIQEFLNIQQNLNNVNKSTNENLLNILKLLCDHEKYINDNIKNNTNSENLCESIQKIYDFLDKNIGNNDYFTELILNICIDETKKIRNEKYRQKLTDVIIKNQKLISKSYKFISIILNGLIDIDADFILENLDNIQNNKNLYIDLICKVNSDSLNEIILSIFEKEFNSYFDSIPKLDEGILKRHFQNYSEYLKIHEKKNICCTLLDKSLEIFNQCLNFLEKIYKNKEEKNNDELICKLYCIAYVKMYLSKCIYYNYIDYQNFIKFNEIIKIIEGKANNNFRKIVKIYVFKMYFNLV